jgi:hypothetical protein
MGYVPLPKFITIATTTATTKDSSIGGTRLSIRKDIVSVRMTNQSTFICLPLI